ICTSMKASAKSCSSTSSNASSPERAVKSSSPSRLRRAESAIRFSSMSSTSRNFTFSSMGASGAGALRWADGELLEEGLHLSDGENPVRGGGLDRGLRHERRLGGVGSLHDAETTCPADRPEPLGPVFVGAGEHHAQDPLAE